MPSLFVFNVPPTAMVIWGQGHGLVLSDGLEKPVIEPATPGLHGKWFILYTIAVPTKLAQENNVVRLNDCLDMTIAAVWDIKPQTIQPKEQNVHVAIQ